MDKAFKFILPSPNFNKNARDNCNPKPHYLIPSGMSLLPREKQPPPMYGEHGSTVPARYLKARDAKEPQFVRAIVSNPIEKQYCEPCELELHSLEDLKRHRAQHEKCPVAGCLYKGHPSVMDKHVSALHSSGLFDKFKKFSTPEEIAAWRDERRKRYPTLANVLLKQKAKEQRQKRGERLEHKGRFGKINDRKRAQHNTQERECSAKKRKREENKTNRNKKNRKNKNNRKSIFHDTNTKVQNNVEQKDKKTEQASYDTIQKFRGTSYLENYKHINDKKNADSNNILFGLVGMYGSDDDESEVSNDDNVIEKKVVNAIERSKDEFSIELTENKTNSLTIEVIATSTGEQNSVFGVNVSEISAAVDESSKSANKSQIEPSALIRPVNKTLMGSVEKPVFNESKIITCKTNDDNIEKGVFNESQATGASKENDASSDEAPEETPIQRNMPHYPLQSENKLKIISLEKVDSKQNQLTDQTTGSKKQLVTRKFGLDYRKARLRKQNTMLEKLLEMDIRHERNVLLQCVRYVCENDFFNIIQNKNLEIINKNKL